MITKNVKQNTFRKPNLLEGNKAGASYITTLKSRDIDKML